MLTVATWNLENFFRPGLGRRKTASLPQRLIAMRWIVETYTNVSPLPGSVR